MTTKGVLVLLMTVMAVQAARKQVQYIGEWGFQNGPALTNQIQSFISGRSSAKYLKPVQPQAQKFARKPGASNLPPPRPKMQRFSASKGNGVLPSFSIHGNSAYLNYPKSKNIKVVPRTMARERIFIRKHPESPPATQGNPSQPPGTPRWIPVPQRSFSPRPMQYQTFPPPLPMHMYRQPIQAYTTSTTPRNLIPVFLALNGQGTDMQTMPIFSNNQGINNGQAKHPPRVQGHPPPGPVFRLPPAQRTNQPPAQKQNTHLQQPIHYPHMQSLFHYPFPYLFHPPPYHPYYQVPVKPTTATPKPPNTTRKPKPTTTTAKPKPRKAPRPEREPELEFVSRRKSAPALPSAPPQAPPHPPPQAPPRPPPRSPPRSQPQAPPSPPPKRPPQRALPECDYWFYQHGVHKWYPCPTPPPPPTAPPPRITTTPTSLFDYFFFGHPTTPPPAPQAVHHTHSHDPWINEPYNVQSINVKITHIKDA